MRAPRLATMIVAACASTPLFAAETATVVGRVADVSGAVVPGAVVTARNLGTGLSRSAVTDERGAYRIPVLPPGAYAFDVALAGFHAARRDGVRLNLGAEVTLDFTLKPASVAEELTVTAEAPLIETTNSAVYTLVTREQIDVLPLIGRDYLSLAKLAPGVQVTAGGNDIGGGRSKSNTYLVDGMDNGGEFTGTRLQATNLDAVEEFQVMVNSFKAEYGRAAGGVISVLTRSGRNEFRGGAFFLYRDQSMVARDPFVRDGDPNDPFERMQYGGFFGGPIRKDRTHFFASLEYEDREFVSTRTLPLPRPGAVVSPVTAQFLQDNGIVIPFEGGSRRFVRPESARYPRASVRFDHAANPRHHVTLNLHWERESLPSGVGGTFFDTQGFDDVDEHASAQLNHKWIASPTRLNELYLKIGRQRFQGTADHPDLVNISIDEAGGMFLGSSLDRPQRRTDEYVQLVDNYTIHRPRAWHGSHVLKFGLDGKLFRSRDNVFDQNFRGTFSFTTVASFLAGEPRRYSSRVGDTAVDAPLATVGLYAQDDWTVGPRLTLNLGLRWDYERGTVEALKDIPPGSPLCAYTDRCGRAGTANSDDYDNVSPRIGFVWDPRGNGKAAVHGGAGLYYDQVLLNIQGNGRFAPPRVNTVEIVDPGFPDPFRGGTRSAIPSNAVIVDESLVTPYSLHTTLGVKSQLGTNLAGDATFTWTRGRGQVLFLNVNTIDPVTRRRPDPAFTNVNVFRNDGTSEYRALTLELRRRMAGRYQWGVAYTLSRLENNGDTFFIASAYQFPRQPERSVGPGDEDRRHVVVGHAVARLPWDFDLGAILDLRSELPLTIFAGGVDIDGDGVVGDYPEGYDRNQVRELSLEEANRLRRAFNRPPIAEFQDNPRYFNVNATLQKRVRLGGERALRLTAEVFNVFNRPNYARPVTSVTAAAFGQRTALDVSREARMRNLQLTVQIDF